jgi:DNA-binding response OmpR family regulator
VSDQIRSTPARPIVIVDDDDDAHFLLQRALAKAGLSQPIKSFYSGGDFLSHLQECMEGRERWPHSVFLDIKMPGMSGFEVLQEMRARAMLTETVVAMISSSENRSDIARAFQLGARSYVPKAFEPKRLIEVVNAAAGLPSPPTTNSVNSTQPSPIWWL